MRKTTIKNYKKKWISNNTLMFFLVKEINTNVINDINECINETTITIGDMKKRRKTIFYFKKIYD
jgi:hypothetical protein